MIGMEEQRVKKNFLKRIKTETIGNLETAACIADFRLVRFGTGHTNTEVSGLVSGHINTNVTDLRSESGRGEGGCAWTNSA